MIHLGDSIYLFSKNRTKPCTGYTFCYRIPDTPGYYIDEKVDSFYTGNGPMEVDWITASTFRENPRTLILLGYNKMWMFYYFEGTKFFSGKHNVLYFDTFTQKEAVTFKNNSSIFISDEKNNKNDGLLYELKLPVILEEEVSLESNLLDSNKVEIENLIIDNTLQINFALIEDCSWHWQAFNEAGQRLQFRGNETLKKGSHTQKINSEKWTSGK